VYKPFAAELLLKKLKPLLAARRVVFSPRHWRKTRDFMVAEGLAEEDVFDILGHLHPEHCEVGPYIKLKIWSGSDGEHAAVLSFHEEGQHD
jgi:hypothetical protein